MTNRIAVDGIGIGYSTKKNTFIQPYNHTVTVIHTGSVGTYLPTYLPSLIVTGASSHYPQENCAQYTCDTNNK
jgi:hypothetical protein